ncbi:MAG: archaeosortase/exosortase family protein [Pirellula sp.]
MDKKIPIALLAIGTGLMFPSVQCGFEEITSAHLWFELFLWGLGIVGLVATGISKRQSFGFSGRYAQPGYVLITVLALALVSLVLANYTGNPAWGLRASSICLCVLSSLLLGLSANRLGHLAFFCLLVPNALWTFAYEIHWVGQRLSTVLAGSILDLAKVFYFSKGNVIGLVSADFLENQQCAGLRLFGPVLSLVALYGGLRNYSVFRMIFLLAESLFWIVVGNALRIAYCIWAQDSQQSAIEFNFIGIDLVCLVGILFLTWSGDQFYTALTYKEKELERDDAVQAILGESDATGISSGQWSVGLRATIGMLLLGIILMAAWMLYQRRFVSPSRMRNEVAEQAVLQLKLDPTCDGWNVQEIGASQETFRPVFSQSTAWPHRQWELTNEQFQQGKMILRIDGAWAHPPRVDWLWHWYGWSTDRPQIDSQSVSSWAMSRSIVEEGFVTSKQIGLTGEEVQKSACLQVSLVREGFKRIGDSERTMQRELFAKLVDRISERVREERSKGSRVPEAP